MLVYKGVREKGDCLRRAVRYCRAGRQAQYVVSSPSLFERAGCSHLKRVCHIWWPQKELSQNTWLMLSSIQVIPSCGWNYQISSERCGPTLTDVHKYTKRNKDASKVTPHSGLFSVMPQTCLWTPSHLWVKGPVYASCASNVFAEAWSTAEYCTCWVEPQNASLLFFLPSVTY